MSRSDTSTLDKSRLAARLSDIVREAVRQDLSLGHEKASQRVAETGAELNGTNETTLRSVSVNWRSSEVLVAANSIRRWMKVWSRRAVRRGMALNLRSSFFSLPNIFADLRVSFGVSGRQERLDKDARVLNRVIRLTTL